GEGGAIIGPPTLTNAIMDALSPFGEITDMHFPLTPSRILDVIEQRDISGDAARRAASEGKVAPAPEASPSERSETLPDASEAIMPGGVQTGSGGIDGDWNVVMKPPMGPQQEMVAHFETDGTALSGYLDAPEGRQDFTGSVEGNTLKWEMKVEQPMKITLKYNLTIEGDKLSGKCKLGMLGSAKVSGERA
ncbi:MAG: xanthine dehydrogenase family protein molybdopterin-binding subunit, partial [Novosphingobium sp.]|nr:xanthine dehydrogenase family protein molybdopterin-binding subunit [Novosphingobium sp.]